MPRSNRPRRGRSEDAGEDVDLSRALFGRSLTEHKRGLLWNVHPVSAVAAIKVYLCPGCGLEIMPGTAHVVAWRADGLMGEVEDLADRRHWHSHCWKIS